MFLSIARHNKTGKIALFSILLTLWLSFAFIDHQFDTIADHHSHHDCQLFASILNGVKSTTLMLAPAIVHGFIAQIAEPIRISRPTEAYLARSPPKTVLRKES